MGYRIDEGGVGIVRVFSGQTGKQMACVLVLLGDDDHSRCVCCQHIVQGGVIESRVDGNTQHLEGTGHEGGHNLPHEAFVDILLLAHITQRTWSNCPTNPNCPTLPARPTLPHWSNCPTLPNWPTRPHWPALPRPTRARCNRACSALGEYRPVACEVPK